MIQRASVLPKGVFFAVGVGAAFGLGVVVAGGIGEARGQAETPSADILVRAQEKSKLYEDKRASMKLTYAAELQKPDVEHLEKLPEKGTARAETAATPLEVAPAPPPPTAPAAVVKPADDEPAPAERVDDKRIQQALAKVLGSTPAVVDAPKKGTYSLQVASVPTRAGAETMAKKVGAGARVVEGEVGGKAVFRVRMGSYADRASAEAAKAKLTMPSFIVAD